jgi:putative DNA primase/helicase
MHHHNAQPGINAERVARSLGGASRVGSGWMCRCPAHDDRTPSLHISDRDGGGLLAKCFAGCEQAEVVAALRARGLWEQNNYLFTPQARDRAEVELHRADVKRTDVALDIWKTAAAANRTLVERYLGSRGLYLPLPITIRFHEGLKHSSGSFWPAMVALVRRGVDDQWMAIHRTFLAKDGMSKAPVAPQKMMLGPCRGSAVRLGAPSNVLMVGEGIETCLSAMQATGNPAWAALSTSGLRALDLPIDVRDVIVLCRW